MNIKIKEKSNLEKEIIITLSNDEIEIEKNNKISDLLKSTTLKGFRKGHLTKDILIHKFGEKINNDSLKDLINKIFIDIVNKNNFKIISLPLFQISKLNKDTIVTINFEILPEINLNTDNIEIIEYIPDMTNNDIIQEIEKLKLIHGTWEETSLQIIANDLITIDVFSLENNQEKQILIDYTVLLNDDIILFENFIENMTTLSTNMDININLKYKKIFNTMLKNKDDIRIYVKKVMRSKKIDTDLELKKKLSIENNLEINIKNKLENNNLSITKKLLRISILEKLLDNNAFDIPKSLIKDALYDYEKKKINIALIDIEKNIRLELILNEIKTKFNITVLQEEIQQILDAVYKNTKINKDLLYKKIENSILEEKILNIIIKKINIISKKITYKEFKKLELENVYKY